MTLQYAVIGHPVAHSRSPAIQNAAFRWCGIDATYGIIDVDEAGVGRVFDDLRAGRLAGVNVTMPHKQRAAAAADHVSDVAGRAGAVNTLWGSDGALHGHITDVDGVLYAWHEAGWTDEPALVLGAGGAAAAACLAFEGRRLFVSARRHQAAADLVERLAVDAEVVPWGEPAPGAVVVNATPIGMHGEDLPERLVPTAAGLLDMVYGHGMTPARASALGSGLTAVDGTSMLVGQGAAAFSTWTGAEAPRGVMLKAFMGTESG